MKTVFRHSSILIIWILSVWLAAGCGRSTSVFMEEGTEQEPEPVLTDAAEEEENQEDTKKEEVTEIYVDVRGAVRTPGVYQLPSGSRIFQAIEMAGGVTGEAAVELVNQAEILQDGQQIHIYTRQEAEEMKKEQTLMTTDGAVCEAADGKIDLNRADKSALMTLTGIGETRAEAILDYREKNGGFSCIEDLMKVEGIKEKTYEKLKDEITVN